MQSNQADSTLGPRIHSDIQSIDNVPEFIYKYDPVNN